MSIEALIDRLVTAVEANTQAVQVLTAGREAALEQMKKAVEAGDAPAAPRATRTRKKAEETAAPADAGNGAGNAEGGSTTESPAVSQSTAQTAETPSSDPDAGAGIDVETLDATIKQAVTEYLACPDAEKAGRTENVKSVMTHFGSQLIGPNSKLDTAQKQQALFYVRRFAARLEVNFSQDYDFAGDPAQGAASEDEFNIG